MFKISDEARANLIKDFNENNQYGKIMGHTDSTTGLFKFKPCYDTDQFIGNVKRFDSDIKYCYAVKSDFSPKEIRCFLTSMQYQSKVKDKNGILLCEGDIVKYKKNYRVIEAKKNGTIVYFSFTKLDDEGNKIGNPIPLEDINDEKHIMKLYHVGNIFADGVFPQMHDETKKLNDRREEVTNLVKRLGFDDLDRVYKFIDYLEDRKLDVINGTLPEVGLQVGESSLIEIFVTDEKKALNYFMKMLRDNSTMDDGFTATSIMLSRDQYYKHTDKRMRDKIQELTGKLTSELYLEINKILDSGNK